MVNMLISNQHHPEHNCKVLALGKAARIGNRLQGNYKASQLLVLMVALDKEVADNHRILQEHRLLGRQCCLHRYIVLAHYKAVSVRALKLGTLVAQSHHNQMWMEVWSGGIHMARILG